MTQFDSHTLAHLKKLCRIECSPQEEEDIFSSLKRVLVYVDSLKEVDTQDVPPCNSVLKGMFKTSLRDDVLQDLLPRDQFLANASDQIGGMVRVPPVLKTHET